MRSEGPDSPSNPPPRRRGFVTLHGIAAKVTKRTRVEGAGAATGFYEVRFELEGLPVVSRITGQVMEVEDGEEMLVAGYFKGREVWAQAWWNRTAQKGYEPATWFFWPVLVSAVVLSVFGLILVCVSPSPASRKVALSILPLALLLGFSAYSARCRWRAIAAVRAMKTQKALKRS